MSNHYIQFKLAHQSMKVDGKEYKAGDVFPFDPGNRNHFYLYQQGALRAERVSAGATEVDATDSAVKLANKHGISLATVKGTGADGRILKSDVEALVDGT